MAVTRASKLISLTDNLSSVVFYVSARKIIKVQVSGSNSLVTYIDQDGSKRIRLVTETAASIRTQTLTNDVTSLQAITLVDTTVVYVNNDRVVFVDTLASGNAVLRLDEGDRRNIRYEFTLPTAANFRTATDNMISVTTIATTSMAATVRYINNYYIDQVTAITGGSEVLYDTNRTAEFQKLNITTTPSSLATVVNAL